MSSFDKVKPSLIPYYDSDFKEAALTDEEAALLLLQMRTGIVPLPPSGNRGQGSGSRSQEPVHDDNISGAYCGSDLKGPALTDHEAALVLLQMRTGIPLLPVTNHLLHESGSQSQQLMHDSSFARISDTTTHSKRNKKKEPPSQSISYISDLIISDAPSNTRYPGLGSQPIGYDLDVTISDAPSGAEYSGLDVGNDSDATISDPELDNKYKYVQRNLGSHMITEHDSDELISAPQSKVNDPPESSMASPQSKVKRNKNTVSKTDLQTRSLRHCSQCFQLGHNCRTCPDIPCTYEGCHEWGHIRTNCPKQWTKRHKDRNRWQRSYIARKRSAARNADQD